MDGDETPVMSEHEDTSDGITEPTGNLADLARNVGMQPANGPATATSTSGAKPKTKKNKGVRKGCSGSSGPPPPRRKRQNNLLQHPVDEDSDEEQNVEVDETAEPGATQHIMVGVQHGYSVYPGYLFDVPPKRIRIDHLCKQFMIHEIA